MLTVKHVSHYKDYKLYVELSNGLRGLFDIFPYLEFGIFTQLKNLGYLKAVKINFCGICWPNGQDFSADTIEHTMEVWDQADVHESHLLVGIDAAVIDTASVESEQHRSNLEQARELMRTLSKGLGRGSPPHDGAQNHDAYLYS